MRVVLSIILIVTLLVLVFYGFDFKEDFQGDSVGDSLVPVGIDGVAAVGCYGTGMQGPVGRTGPVGPQGMQGDTGLKGDGGPRGEKGDNGIGGDKGDQGLTGHTGPVGIQGVDGQTGPVGNSAYEDAYNEAMSENQIPDWVGDNDDNGERIDRWIASLKGEQGIVGPVVSVTGPVGNSAYNIAYNLEEQKSNENQAYWFNSEDKDGHKDDWLTSLTGAVGPTGPVGPPSYMPAGSIVAFKPPLDGTIPNGWQECDGNNGTPDLRGRFILGSTGTGTGTSPRTEADSPGEDPTAISHSLGQTGGVEKHKLTDAEQHQSDHTHELATPNVYLGTDRTGDSYTPPTDDTSDAIAHENMPPFFVLIYIMKK
jgi:hypothetical protein